MQLVTLRFGKVEFQPAELLVFEAGMPDYPKDRQWLLLADAKHENLYWLQSISNSDVAFPVVELSDTEFTADQEMTTSLKLDAESEVLLLAPVRIEGAVLTIDSHLPIIVNAKSGKCRQLRYDQHQADQRTMALMSERLRQSA
ncbi:MAG: flagellar assembly protein FliW [Planctomycetales bacterium]|nr:flagellar assembly protein FliW [Planctomycetales bacterium]